MVWNPGSVGATKISDLPDEDWDNFICIEPIVLAKPILLEPGKTFNAQLTVSAIDPVKS
jgi:glucose-6-phosphate 1-epimerase